MSAERGVGDFSLGVTDSFDRPLPELAVGFILKFGAFFKTLPSPTALVFLSVKSTSLALLSLGLGFTEYSGNPM